MQKNRIICLLICVCVYLLNSCTAYNVLLEFDNNQILFSDDLKEFYANKVLRDTLSTIIEKNYFWHNVEFKYKENLEGSALLKFKYDTSKKKVCCVELLNPLKVKQVDRNNIQNVRSVNIRLKDSQIPKSRYYVFVVKIDFRDVRRDYNHSIKE